MPRPTATSYRFGPDTLALIDALSRHYAGPLGTAIPASEVIRHALRRLAESEGVLTQPVAQKGEKKPRKKG